MTVGHSTRIFAPGGIGNIGPGLDILGCAVTGLGDAVTATLIKQRGVRIDDPGHPDLPRDPACHACGIAAMAVLRRANEASAGVAIKLEKGLPLAGGQGGSAASAVAAAVATNALLGGPLDMAGVLAAALVAEEQLAGRHIDNLGPALFGGILLIRSIEPLNFIQLPVPAELRIVLMKPEMQLRTADARSVLPATVSLSSALAQATAVGAMIAAFTTGKLCYLRGAVDDRIAEPARAPLLPGFIEAKRAALDRGALGCSISGGGPSSFALVEGDSAAGAVMAAMLDAYQARGVRASGRLASVDVLGARVEDAGSPVSSPA